MDVAQIVRTLCYYDVFSHPLTPREIFLFLPQNSISFSEFQRHLQQSVSMNLVHQKGNLYFLSHNETAVVQQRQAKERLARKRWHVARLVARIIKRFPFVQGIFVSGDLAKNATLPESDIDYVIVTAPNRLWICRMFLILFKKVFLLNRKKFFCLNYFVSAADFEAKEKNYFTATEIAHLKPLYNFPIFLTYMNSNCWIKSYFPNFLLFLNNVHSCDGRPSIIQRILELPFTGKWADSLDYWLMKKMETIWKKRYPALNASELRFRFRCSPTESRAFSEELSGTILRLYEMNFKRYISIQQQQEDD